MTYDPRAQGTQKKKASLARIIPLNLVTDEMTDEDLDRLTGRLPTEDDETSPPQL